MNRTASPFRQFCRLLVELHCLIRRNADETPEGDMLREASEPHWNAMSDAERQLSRELSVDLYSIGAPPHAAGENAALLAKEIDVLATRGEWSELLAYCRSRERELGSLDVAGCRVMVWHRLGVPEAAMEFFRQAQEIEPHLIPSLVVLGGFAAVAAKRFDVAETLASELTGEPKSLEGLSAGLSLWSAIAVEAIDQRSANRARQRSEGVADEILARTDNQPHGPSASSVRAAAALEKLLLALERGDSEQASNWESILRPLVAAGNENSSAEWILEELELFRKLRVPPTLIQEFMPDFWRRKRLSMLRRYPSSLYTEDAAA